MGDDASNETNKCRRRENRSGASGIISHHLNILLGFTGHVHVLLSHLWIHFVHGTVAIEFPVGGSGRPGSSEENSGNARGALIFFEEEDALGVDLSESSVFIRDDGILSLAGRSEVEDLGKLGAGNVTDVIEEPNGVLLANGSKVGSATSSASDNLKLPFRILFRERGEKRDYIRS